MKMSPNNISSACVCDSKELISSKESEKMSEQNKDGWKFERKDIKWSNVILIPVFHLIGLYGFLIIPYMNYKTILWELLMGMFAAFGITGGVHRFWTHRSYKANLPLRILLAFCYLCSGMNSIVQWVKDHRVHHKFSETDADPHNANRGFFFSHVGWLMIKKHPDVLKHGKSVDMSDVTSDPVVKFSEKYFIPLKFTLSLIIPIAVPVYFWNESWYYSFFAAIARLIFVLNATWSVNSVAHIWGNKPYDKDISPVENSFVSYVTFGEGWHNYHHTFPWDYRAAEIGGGRFNWTATLIDFFAKIGWAYKLREPSEQVILNTVLKKGDGTHESIQTDDEKIE